MKFSDTLDQMKSKYAMSEYHDTWYKTKIESLPSIYREGDIGREKAERYLKEGLKNGIFLTGRAGCGKTSIATQILRIIWERKIDGKFVEYQDWILELEDKRRGGNTFREVKELQEFDGLLVLDDIGFEDPSNFIKRITYLIVNHRVSNDLPLIITSNLFLEEIGDFYDPRLVSRIEQHCEKIEPSGRDYRVSREDDTKEEA